MIMFNAQSYPLDLDFDTAEGAIAAVEANGSGIVVKFHGRPNNPGCLPEIVWNSSSMWSFENGKWRGHYIHDGLGAAVNEERPH